MTNIHGEIQYINDSGEGVHSDLCPPSCDLSNSTDSYRAFMHSSLEEWLTKSNGTGYFYIGHDIDMRTAFSGFDYDGRPL